MDQVARSIVDKPVVLYCRRIPHKANAKVLTAKVDRWIRKLVSHRRVDWPTWNRSIGSPSTVSILGTLIANKHLWMLRIGYILIDLWHTVVVVVIGVRDVRRMAVVDFNLKAMGFDPGIVHTVKIVDAAVSLACHG